MENVINKLDEYMQEALELHDLPGLAVSVKVGENSSNSNCGLEYEAAIGYKDYISKEPLMIDQIFHMASVSKLFVSTAILQLCKEGKLELESTLAEQLPFVQMKDQRYEKVTLRQMLTHTSGLADVGDYHWDAPRIDERALKDYSLSEEVLTSSLLWDPGQGGFRYSNMAFELLGLIIAERSGISFEQFIQQHILASLQMENSTFLTFQRGGGSLALEKLSRANMAMPHTKDEKKHIVLEKCYPYNRQHGPSSTLTSTMEDLSKWADAHLRCKLFAPEFYEEIWKPYGIVPNNGEEMGLGWFMREQKGFRLCGHEGTDDGFRASFWICPQLDVHVIVASNLSQAPVKKINKKLFDIITD